MLSDDEFDSPPQYAKHMFAALRNLRDLEQREIRNVITSVLSPTVRERTVTLNYQRAAFNIETILALPTTDHFQGIAMLSRAIFESSVEMRLINLHPDAGEKASAVMEFEKLRSAEDVVAFKRKNPAADVFTRVYEEFIASNGAAIRAQIKKHWPASNNVNHWMNKKLPKRISGLGEPYERIYKVHYAQLSWYSHSGITGVMNIEGEMLAAFVGICYQIAVESYMQILEIVVNEFNLYKADPKLKDKIQYNKLVAFARNQPEADGLMRLHGLG
jgi:hypothetical protein